MNIAILIGVSEYKTESDLPACLHDAENMTRLLISTKKYDDILTITKNTQASQLKDSIRGFFKKHQSESNIDEALIYFSGHGVYNSDAFLCCSDFSSDRPATTSISNSELDDLLRSVSPKVAVKIIDACQSGSPYIKDADGGFEKALKKSQLDSFICMASSRKDQYSYASSSTESDFTSKWIEAATEKTEGTVLYRDIQAALADAFSADHDQTPFFVNQGTGLEVFSTVTEEMISFREISKTVMSTRPDTAVVTEIEKRVIELDSNFVQHKQAIDAAEESKKLLSSWIIRDEVVDNFYKALIVTDSKLSTIPKSREVAKFAEEQSWSKRYFCKINKEQYEIKSPRDIFTNLTRPNLFRQSDDNFIIETKSRPSSLEVTEHLPIELAEVHFTSNHPSLPSFIIYIGFVHSLTEVMTLSATAVLVQKGWNSRAPELSQLQWRYQSYPWTKIVNSPSMIWSEALVRGEAEIRAFLESLAPKAESTQAANPQAQESVEIATE